MIVLDTSCGGREAVDTKVGAPEAELEQHRFNEEGGYRRSGQYGEGHG